MFKSFKMTKRGDLWWHEYRRRRFRPRRKISVELLLRDVIKKCFTEFINNCSIAGVKQMIDPTIALKQRIIWMLVFAGMCGMVFYFFWYMWLKGLSTPLIVSKESSKYPISEIDFPAIAICNINRISKKAMFEFETKTLNRTVKGNIREMMTWQFGGLIDYTYNVTLRSRLHLNSEYAPTLRHAPNVIDTMKKLAPSCEEMLIKCTWASKVIDCKSIFKVRRTIKGHCCAFNYILDYDADGIPSQKIKRVMRQSQPGSLHGLNLVMDPLIEDYAYTTRHVYGLDILIFDPIHFADTNGGRVVQRVAEPNMALYVELHSVKQIATNEVRKYSLKTRKCLFHDERKKKFNNMYSYSACIVNCRIKAVQTLCKCTPYFMPTSSDIPTCTLNEIPCLNKHKDKLPLVYPMSADADGLDIEFQDSLYCPDCLLDCEFTKHNTKAYKIPIVQLEIDKGHKEFRKPFTNGTNMTNKCTVSIYQPTFHGTLDRLDVVAYWFELLSNGGGVAGILMGLSIITGIEFFYFFIVTFFIQMYNFFSNKNRYY
ncbi:unnamed protein product [Parnassius mnemosyne]|uniref:Sodium channel protein Nach n=1 Tax=Parnassius mnemosyne TaxID=213953 RepID=A0AAV1KLT5_9NEOP